jgi:Rho guanine nucleotide exchange factor 12
MIEISRDAPNCAVRSHMSCFLIFQVFLKARSKAKEELKRHLAEFLSKRTVGLATIFGPSDAVLDETIHDKAKEVKIVESLLLPRLELLA